MRVFANVRNDATILKRKDAPPSPARPQELRSSQTSFTTSTTTSAL